MPTQCLKPVRGKVARITKLDSCGVPVVGAKSQVVTEGFISIEGQIQLEDPQEYKQKNANDKFLYNSRGAPLIKWIDLTLNFGLVDPEAYNLVTGSPIVLDDTAGTPQAVGFRVRENTSANFALELWTDLEGLACVGGTQAYGYMLLPFVKDAKVGNWTWQNDVITFPVQSARTEHGSGWGVGPYNVINKLSAPTGPAPLLDAITIEDHLHMQLTTLAPPSPSCGALSVP
jgi:hypothetical protein